MCKVSVVVPSLNAGKYIYECLDSIVHQTLEDIEILCVDAGSTDKTLQVLHNFMDNDSRVRVLSSPVKSYGYQVNFGITEAKGDYIGIVEADDYIESDMYFDLYRIARTYELDCIKGDHWYMKGEKGDYVKEKKYALRNYPEYYEKVIGDELSTKFLGYMYTWAGIYRRHFLIENRIFHNETLGASYQDNGFWFLTMMYSKRLMFIPKAYYNLRRDNPDSSVFSKSKYETIKSEYDYIRNRIINSKQPNEKELLDYCFLFRLRNEIGRLENIDPKYIGQCYHLIKEDAEAAADKGEVNMALFDDRLKGFYYYVINGNRAIRFSEYKKMLDSGKGC